MSEDTVIRHGAPTLAGMKTGNLFPCFFSSPRALAEELRAMNRVLVPRGLRLVPLRREKGRALLYLFRPAALSRDLAQEEVRRLLRQAGYRDLGQGACLAELRRRLGAGGDFPHEIGLFLGYPPEDVAGFVRHRGTPCPGGGRSPPPGQGVQVRGLLEGLRGRGRRPPPVCRLQGLHRQLLPPPGQRRLPGPAGRDHPPAPITRPLPRPVLPKRHFSAGPAACSLTFPGIFFTMETDPFPVPVRRRGGPAVILPERRHPYA